jgi:hypothetical protein
MATGVNMAIPARYLSRKFMLTCYFALTATAGLFTGYLNGGEFVEVTLAILGTHHIANYFGHKTSQ